MKVLPLRDDLNLDEYLTYANGNIEGLYWAWESCLGVALRRDEYE